MLPRLTCAVRSRIQRPKFDTQGNVWLHRWLHTTRHTELSAPRGNQNAGFRCAERVWHAASPTSLAGRDGDRLDRRRRPTVLGLKLGGQLTTPRVDSSSAGGPEPDQAFVDAGDLAQRPLPTTSLPLDKREAEPFTQLGFQAGVIPHGGGDCGLVQHPPVQRPPPPVAGSTLLLTAMWVYRSGSPARESRWMKAAATKPRVCTWRMPFFPSRVWAAQRSSQAWSRRPWPRAQPIRIPRRPAPPGSTANRPIDPCQTLPDKIYLGAITPLAPAVVPRPTRVAVDWPTATIVGGA